MSFISNLTKVGREVNQVKKEQKTEMEQIRLEMELNLSEINAGMEKFKEELNIHHEENMAKINRITEITASGKITNEDVEEIHKLLDEMTESDIKFYGINA